ncbi:hypothetical protein PM082_021209 [Marasmius tenuissimus]|nr:hypothetical protein PM082_021209 [Marasmius tenuissimus]
MNSKEIMKNFLHSPTATISLNNPDPKSSRAIAALLRLAGDISQHSDTAARILENNWTRLWPWIASWSRAVLDTQPTTTFGQDTVDQMLTLMPYVFLCRLDGGHDMEDPPSLQRVELVFSSTPNIAAMALELWLLAESLGHHIIPFFGDIAGSLVLECLKCEEVPSARQHYDEVFSRWDIPAGLVRAVVREAIPKFIDTANLRIQVAMLATLPQNAPSRPGHPTSVEACILNHAPRWLAYVIRRLASSRVYTHNEDTREDISYCLQDATRFLSCCFMTDCYSALEVLDLDILPSIFQHHDLIAEDYAKGSPRKLVEKFTQFLYLLSSRLYHRKLLVRVLRSMKKVEKMGIDAPTYLKGCGDLLDAWKTLCKDATVRWVPGKTGEGWYEVTICGYTQCPHRGTLKLHHKFKRCGSCLVEIYCSNECQKAAWRVHRRECNSKKVQLQKTPACHNISSLELAFMYKCVYQEYYSNPGEFRKLIRLSATTNRNYVILIDRRIGSRTVEPIPLSRAEALIKEYSPGFPGMDVNTEEAFCGIAIMPWRTDRPLIIIIRTSNDRKVTEQAKNFNTNWRHLAPVMNSVLLSTDPGPGVL